MQFILFGLASFVLMILLAVFFRLFSMRSSLDATLHDPLNTKPRKLSSKELVALQQKGSVTYGVCTTTKQSVWQAPSVQKMNTLFLGPTGVGKTLHAVSTAIAQYIHLDNNAMVVFDGKNDPSLIGILEEYAKQSNREFVVFPYEGYNPLGIGGTAEQRAAMFCSMIQLAREAMTGDAAFYTDEMVKFVSLIIPVFEQVYGVPCTLNELRLLATSESIRTDLLNQIKGTDNYTEFTESYSAYKQKDISDKLASLVSMITGIYSSQGRINDRRILYNQRMAKGLGEAIDKGAVIVVAEGGNRGSSEHHIGMLYMAELMNYVRNRKTNHDVVVVLDELHYYLSDTFVQFQATSRASNVIQILGIQNFSMLEGLSKTACESIKTNCRTWIIHTDLKYPDALLVSREVGERPFIAYSKSSTEGKLETTKGERLEDKPLIDPYKIQHMKPNLVLYLSVNEQRGREPARYLVKPPLLDDGRHLYIAPPCSFVMPDSMWNLQAKQQAQQVPVQVNNALQNIVQGNQKRGHKRVP